MRPLIRLLRLLTRRSAAGSGRAAVGLAAGAGILGGAASAAFIAVINAALQGGGRSARLAAAFLALCVLLPACRFLSTFVLLRLTEKTQFDIRMELSRRLLATPLRTFEELSAPRLLAMLTDDVGAIVAVFTNLPLLLMHVTVVASCLAYICWLSPRLFLVILAVLGIGVVTYVIPMRRAQHYHQLVREVADRQFRQFRGLTEGIKELKLHAARRDAFLDGEMSDTARERMGYRMRAGLIQTMTASWGQVAFFLTIGLILFVLPGPMAIDTRVLAGASFAILYILTPIDTLMSLVPQLNGGIVAAGRLAAVGVALAAPAQDAAAGNGQPSPPRRWRCLELAGVTHTYRRESDDDTFTLGPIDLVLRPGECVFVVGGNGSGKTTLAKLLTGLYQPQSGQVLLDGRQVADGGWDAYGQLFSAIFSDSYLFDSLLGFDAAAVDGHAQGYLEKLHLGGKVRMKAGAFSSTDLSQGQRKRLALLTAYLEDRPIYLFDEWAADQDPLFKELFYRQLLPELKARGKTAVVISHDDRYFSTADRLIKLEDGRLVASS